MYLRGNSVMTKISEGLDTAQNGDKELIKELRHALKLAV